jgi:hypothetical protein
LDAKAHGCPSSFVQQRHQRIDGNGADCEE